MQRGLTLQTISVLEQFLIAQVTWFKNWKNFNTCSWEGSLKLTTYPMPYGAPALFDQCNHITNAKIKVAVLESYIALDAPCPSFRNGLILQQSCCFQHAEWKRLHTFFASLVFAPFVLGSLSPGRSIISAVLSAGSGTPCTLFARPELFFL